MERIQAEKMSILRRCKMEEINIPFSNGAFLNDISLDELDVCFIFDFIRSHVRRMIWNLMKN
jgi:hypothetical protein